jgi:iron complex outermembrane receptor protein
MILRAAVQASCTAILYTVSAASQAQAQATSPASQPADDSLSEILVTAERRSERLSDVPIAVVALSSQQMETAGVDSVRDLQVLTPGLITAGNGADFLPSIRGVHSQQTDPGNDSNVSLYVDGVYQPNAIANNMDLADVDRVEVLKGPQGTLFGRNATGGAIRIFTLDPSFTPKGSIDLSYGRFNDATVKGYISGPIASDVLAGSLSAFYENSRSYDRNIITDDLGTGIRSGVVRGKLLFVPTDALRVTLMSSYVHRFDSNATAYEPLNGNTVARLFPGAIFPTSPWHYALPNAPDTKGDTFSAALRADWTLASVGTLSSLTSYNHVNVFYSTDAPASQLPLLNYPINETQHDTSEELTFASDKFGMLQATAGLYYYDNVGNYEPLVVQGSLVPTSLYGYMSQTTQAYAGFGELTITPLDSLSLVLGARYSHEVREASGTYNIAPVTPDPLPALGSADFNAVTPRASIRYSFPTGDNVYFTYSEGFKSGGFNLSTLATSPFQPEKLDAYEIGFKTIANRPVSGNFSLFYYDYRDQQVEANVDNFNITANAASSRIWGADADITMRPVHEFTATLGVSYLHARFNSYVNAAYNTLTPPATPGGPACLCGNATTTGNLTGATEPFSPTLTVSATAAYRKELSPGTMTLNATVYDTSRFQWEVGGAVQQPAYATLGARASFEPTGTRLTLYVWGKNLTNRAYFNTTFLNNSSDGVTYAPPRTYGAGLSYQF